MLILVASSFVSLKKKSSVGCTDRWPSVTKASFLSLTGGEGCINQIRARPLSCTVQLCCLQTMSRSPRETLGLCLYRYW